MLKNVLPFALLLGVSALTVYHVNGGVELAHAASEEGEMTQGNPLLAEWSGPYGGLPPFDQVKEEHFEPAIEAAITEYLNEVDRIASERKKPTFENTIAALDNADGTLDRVYAVYGVFASTMNTPNLTEIQQRVAPKFAALNDEVIQNEALFARVAAVWNSKKLAKLTPEQQRLTWVTYNRFAKSGATLEGDAKARLAEINQALATAYTSFSQHLLADESTYIVLEGEGALDGLPDSYVSAAAASAAAEGIEGGYIVNNTRSSVDPFLTYSENRVLREKVWRAYVSRGDNGDDNDNNALITQILKLRAERAALLGFDTHAHWRLSDTMAGSPDRAMALMESVWAPAVARVAEEVAAQQAIADAEGDGITIEPWDYRFYMEKVRKDKYDLDQNVVKPYLQMENLREGMMWAAGELYGLQFRQVDDVPVYHEDVRVWEVLDASGEHVGLWYFDPFARKGKRSGAWMNAYRSQQKWPEEVTIIVSNNSNFVKGAPGEPVLISWDDANTLFHEFGHALHGLLSDVTYAGLSGTAVARDYVEFPSQLNEHWLSTPEVLNQFALHAETGEPMPAELLKKLEESATFNQGFGTVEYLASALIDMKLHLAGDVEIDPDTFESETLTAMGMPSQLVMRHRTPQFAHVFSGDGYSAGYYSYLWSDTLTADAAEAFEEAGSMYDPTVAAALRASVLSVGNTIDPGDGYREFRGRDVDTSALMRKRGFPTE